MTPIPPATLAPPLVDAAIETARPLRGAYYADPHWLAHERRALFGRCWNYAAHADQFAEDGSYAAVQVAGQPLVIVRDGDALRGFYNVCRHRGGPLVEGCGRQRRFTCRYHGWSYALDGRPLRAPFMAEELAAQADELRLKPVRVERWANLVFVNLNPAASSLPDHLASMQSAASRCALERMRHVTTRRYPVSANWKVYVDNYLEGYHLPAVHPGLNRELDFRAYVTELGEHHSCQYAPIAPGRGGGRVYDAEARAGGGEARYYWLFPNLMLNVYQGYLQTNLVEPVSVDETLVHFDWFALEAPVDDAGRERLERLIAFSEEVQAEDAAICAAVQRNLASNGFEPGPYSRRFETGVHQFHRLYAGWLAQA